MKPTIEDKVIKLKTKYEGNAGIKPTRLYVGWKEYEKILELPMKWLYMYPTKRHNRDIFCGLELYLVDATKHLDCS